MNKEASIPGYADYQRREYCQDVQCPRQLKLDREAAGSAVYEKLRGLCQTECLHTTYEFHHWLIGKGYLIVRPEK